MLMLAACKADDALSVTDTQEKTPIELSVGVVGESPASMRGNTRTVITTDKQDKDRKYMAAPFTADTKLYMVMKSEDANSNATYTRTIGTAAGIAAPSDEQTSSDVTFASDFIRYWEDSYSRDSKLSFYSLCAPSADSNIQGILNTWGSVASGNAQWAAANNTTTIAWPMLTSGTAADAVASQTTTFISNQDLCFSNNVSKYTIGSDETDARVSFDSSTKKFGKGRLVFYHALTKVTFKFEKGEGFGDGTDVFQFTESGKNMVLTDFNTSGTFDVATGEFTDIAKNPINQFAVGTAETDYPYVFHAIMLPGTDLNDETAGDISFTIDHNEYHLTKKQLMTALDGKTTSSTNVAALDENKMRPGVEYIFTLEVGKTKVAVSAAVVDWETVTAEEMTPTNARIQVSLLDKGTKLTGSEAQFDLYRTVYTHTSIDDSYADYTWSKGYVLTDNSNKAVLTENTADPGIYTANDNSNKAWYWPNNKTFYHFRTVMPTNHTVTKDDTNGDYITLTAAPNYTDVCWGAPFYKYTQNNSTTTEVTSLTYSLETGFDNTGTYHQISKGIGPTTGVINMELFHMMSDVTIQLTTTVGDDAVTLAGATVSLTNTYPTGTVLMGNGLVTPTGDVVTAGGTVNEEKKWHYGFIPQPLDTSGNEVVLTITTTDDNRYIVDLADVVATTVSNTLIANPYDKNTNGKYMIKRWYPNYKYTYTFKLTKADIAQITATLADWESVTADEQGVQIK